MKIHLKLNEDSINQAIQDVKAYEKRLAQMSDILCRSLVQEGIATARSRILVWGAYDSHKLYESVEGFYDPVEHKGYIRVCADDGEYGFNYAQVVEFGSGVNGRLGSSPGRPSDYQLDIHHHGERGWYYWKNGKWNHTLGQIPRPFFWETYQELLEKAEGKGIKVRYYNVPSYY